MPLQRIFVPFGELKPDSRQFNNDGLLVATNLAPIGDSYHPFGWWKDQSSGDVTGAVYGLHAHSSAGTWLGYYGAGSKLRELSNTTSSPWTDTDRSGAAYSAPDSQCGWQGASFGDSVVMTSYTDDPQLLVTAGTGTFTKLALSGSGTGMDPKAKFAFPVRNNMALANLNLSSGFDGLPSGANPTVVAWSQTDNLRQYGSFNATPQLTGTGYQALNFDLGYITGGVGGEYGLIALQNGWVRMDGPPYTFRPLPGQSGCQFPNSIVRFDSDVYFWGASGPSVLRGGDGAAVGLVKDRLLRSLFETGSALTNPYASAISTSSPTLVSAAVDVLNRQIWWSYPVGSNLSLVLAYDVDADRFGVCFPVNTSNASLNQGIYFLCNHPENGALAGSWCPGRDIVAFRQFFGGQWRPASVVGSNSTTGIPVTAGMSYKQLSNANTTRILRVRLVYSTTASNRPSTTVSIASKSKPGITDGTSSSPISNSSASMDSHDWNVAFTPATVMADFHKITVTLSPLAETIEEIEGVEIEFENGPAY